MLDLSKLDSVLVDPVRLRARCGGGATWAELDGMANRQGLAVTGGFISDTGIGGLTLGGGLGWLTPLFGMSCDNLVAAEVVTADGHVVAASMQENQDLYWALRGGGGNFGIVTGFEFTLHEFGPMVQVALLWWPPSEAVGPLVEGQAVLMDLPARHCGTINAISCPPAPFVPEHWQGVPGFVVGIAGDRSANDLADAVAPLRALTPTPAWELVAEMPYAALQQLFDGIAPWGTFAYEKSLYLDRIDAAVAEVMVEQYPRKHSPLSVMPSMPLCGRFCDVPEGNTAFGGSRDPGVLVNISASCPDPAVFAAEREWVREFWDELRPFARGDGSYVNFLADPGRSRSPSVTAPSTAGCARSRPPGIRTTCSGTTRTSPPPRPERGAGTGRSLAVRGAVIRAAAAHDIRYRRSVRRIAGSGRTNFLDAAAATGELCMTQCHR